MSKDIKIGEFQKFKYPEHAEKFTVGEFTETVIVGTKSKFLDREIHTRVDKMRCPRCKKEADYEQNHGDAFKCGGCGLKRQSFGNALYVWE